MITESMTEADNLAPVAWQIKHNEGGWVLASKTVADEMRSLAGWDVRPLYATPSKDEALLRQCLEVLECIDSPGPATRERIAALRSRLAEMEGKA